MTTFAAHLRKLVTVYDGTKTSLARDVGVSIWHLSRLLSGHQPTIETCLRLAAVTETSAAVALRAAGHTEVACLLERLYGPANSRPLADGVRLSPLERHHLDALRVIDERSRRAIVVLAAEAAAVVTGRQSRQSDRGGVS